MYTQTSAAVERRVDAAKAALAELASLQHHLPAEPTLDRIRQITDLYRQAAELYVAVDDDRAEAVVKRMQEFLQQPLTIAILEDHAPAAVQVRFTGYQG